MNIEKEINEKDKFIVIGLFSDKLELLEFNLIIKYVLIGRHARFLGKQSHKKIKKNNKKGSE